LGHLDPAAAYANEGFDMFEEMIGDIQQETVKYCYNVTVNTTTERKVVIGVGEGRKADAQGSGAVMSRRGAGGAGGAGGGAGGGVGGGQMPNQAPKPEEPRKPETVRRQTPKVGRNDPCPCGSGKKYKNCCMSKDLEQ
jgi:preprotein translocase subunit SecA